MPPKVGTKHKGNKYPDNITDAWAEYKRQQRENLKSLAKLENNHR